MLGALECKVAVLRQRVPAAASLTTMLQATAMNSERERLLRRTMLSQPDVRGCPGLQNSWW